MSQYTENLSVGSKPTIEIVLNPIEKLHRLVVARCKLVWEREKITNGSVRWQFPYSAKLVFVLPFFSQSSALLP